MMFGMCKTKHSSKDCNRCLFIVSKIDILWSSRRTREFINHYFEQVIEPSLVLNIYFTFFLSVVDCTFYKSTINYYVRYASEAVVTSCSVKKAFLEISQNSRENACARVSFKKKKNVNFAKFLRISFFTEHLRWLLLSFQSESTLYTLRTSCSKHSQYLKFKWTRTSWKYNRSNIVQISFLCYVAGF